MRNRTTRLDRAGFTMIEVLVAMTVLGIAVLGVQAALTTRFVGEVGLQDQNALANQHVQTRLEEVRLHPDYLTLEDDMEERRTELPGRGSFLRTTELTRTQRRINGRALDYTTVTVTVESPALPAPLARTAVVAAP